MKSGFMYWLVLILVVAGAINWGLVGLIGFNLVEAIFSFMPILARLVYILVGVAGVMMLIWAFKK